MPRLDNLVARNLGCSRSEARRLIDNGLVSDASGVPMTDRSRDVQSRDLPWEVRVGDRPLRLLDSCHVLLNKPVGCITALKDARHGVAWEFVREAPLANELRPVGRLDLETTGLLLWTTDGAWLQRLTHPKHKVPRTYQAALARPFSPLPARLVLEDGHCPDIEHLAEIDAGLAHPSLIRPDGATNLATITITGGAYHEVRRIFAALDSHVLGLCRVSVGRLVLPDDLAPGDYRPVAIGEVIGE